jgi:hypothetical protein
MVKVVRAQGFTGRGGKKMARGKKETKRRIENYVHAGKERLNNPPVGLESRSGKFGQVYK